MWLKYTKCLCPSCLYYHYKLKKWSYWQSKVLLLEQMFELEDLKECIFINNNNYDEIQF
jgi:hypothetical protein